MLAVSLLVTGLATGCKKKKRGDGTGGGFRFPIAVEPEGLDPQTATEEGAVTVVCALFEGLTRIDTKGKVVPAAATWTVSEDGLTYTFTLKKSYWNANPVEGEKHPWDKPLRVTADDFVFGVQRVADPATGSALAAELYGIQNAEAVIAGKKPVEELGIHALDSRRLTITLTAPDEDFPARVAATPFFPCHREFFDYTAGRYGLEAKYLLSNGPFYLTEWAHDTSLLLYKHEKYHDADHIAPSAVRFVIGAEDVVTDLKTGDLSAAPLTAAQAAKMGKGVSTVSMKDALRGVWLNTAAEPLTNKNVRQALRDSIQWDAVDGYLKSHKEAVATGFVPPAATMDGAAYRKAAKDLPRTTDPDGAKAALQKGLDGAAPSRLHVEFLAAEDAISANLARYILQSWQKHLGISVTLTLVSEAELAKRVRRGQYQVALYTHIPSGLTAGENLASFATAASDNLSRLADKKVDAAVAAARIGGREDVMAAEQALWQAVPVIPVSFPRRYYGFAADVEDIVVRPFGGGRYQSPLDFRGAKMW